MCHADRHENLEMKFLFLIVTIFFFSCSGRHDGSDNHPRNDSTIISPAEIQYSHSDLLEFLDSLGRSDCYQLQLGLVKYADSVFLNRSTINRTLSISDFEKLKKAIKLGKLDLETGKEIFNFPVDSNFVENNSIEITYVPFDKSKDKFGKFAIVIGSLLGSWENDIYFFDGVTLLSRHHNYHKNGSDISWFVDTDGRTIIYYLENFGGGSGIWQYNYFFYKYSDGQLIPALNILQNGNIHLSSADFRQFWFETFVVKTVPLKLKFVFNYDLSDGHNDWIEVKKDSTEVSFSWDKKSNSYIGAFNDKINLSQIHSYCIDGDVDVYNICVDNKYLRSIISGKDSVKSKAVFMYLNKVKNDIRTKTHGT
jgi:hypothetical protein